MTIALVLVPLFAALCVGGYFLVYSYDKFLRRNKKDKRVEARKKRRGK